MTQFAVSVTRCVRVCCACARALSTRISDYILWFFLEFYLNHKTDFSWHWRAGTLKTKKLSKCLPCQWRRLFLLHLPSSSPPPPSLSNSSTSALPLCCLPVCLCVCLFVFIAPCCRVVVVVVVDVSSFISLHSNEAIYEGKCVCVFSS